MRYRSQPSKQDVIRRSAEVFNKYLVEIGVTATEYCKALNLPARTFDSWMANRHGSQATGHTRRGPIKLLRQILEVAILPEHVIEALLDVLEYSERYLRRPTGPDVAPA